MSIVKNVVKFLSDTKPETCLSELKKGRAGAEGTVRIGNDGPLISPVRGQHCVAFYYKAFHFVGSRTGQMMPRKFQTYEVYHSFDIELEDGRIKVVPKKSDEFDSDAHKELSGMGYEGFKAIEDLVLPGMRVRVFGTAKEEGDELVIHYSKLELVEGAIPIKAPASLKKKKKKAKGKAKRK